jgi:phage terminase large subunit
MYFTTNPGGVGHGWFKKAFVAPQRAGRERDTRFIQATVRDNAFINADYHASLAALAGWQRRAWLDGDWEIAAGQYYTTFSREAHVCRPFPVSRGWRFWCALDYGFTHHTCVYLFAQDGDGMVYVVDEHFQRRWLPRRHAPAIQAMLSRHGLELADLYDFVAGGDVFSRGKDRDGLTIADQYAQLGIRLSPANEDRINGAGELLARLGDVENGIPSRLQIFETCPRLIECLPALQHDPRRPEDVLKWDTNDDGEGGDDAYDACRYGLMEAVGAGSAAFDSLEDENDIGPPMFTKALP